MTRRMIVVLLSVLLVLAAVPGIAAAKGAGGPTPVYLSLGSWDVRRGTSSLLPSPGGLHDDHD